LACRSGWVAASTIKVDFTTYYPPTHFRLQGSY
jgi:hypothetical protein